MIQLFLLLVSCKLYYTIFIIIINWLIDWLNMIMKNGHMIDGNKRKYNRGIGWSEEWINEQMNDPNGCNECNVSVLSEWIVSMMIWLRSSIDEMLICFWWINLIEINIHPCCHYHHGHNCHVHHSRRVHIHYHGHNHGSLPSNRNGFHHRLEHGKHIHVSSYRLAYVNNYDTTDNDVSSPRDNHGYFPKLKYPFPNERKEMQICGFF